MTFYVGLALGFGIGGCLLFVVVIFLLARSMDGTKKVNECLFRYWEASVKYQEDHLLIMSDIASSLSKEPILYDGEEVTEV